MDRLPQELIEKVCSFLPHDDLKNILILARKFWYAAERHSGAFTNFTITECNAGTFLTRYSGHRLSFLREVTFRPSFEPILYPEKWEQSCRENAEKLLEKDESFTRQINFLFATLRSVEKQAGEKYAPGNFRLSIHSPVRLVHKHIGLYECLHHHHVSWRVHLMHPTELPPVASVRSLEIHNHGCDDADRFQYGTAYNMDALSFDPVESKLDLRVILDLAAKCPNLEFLGVQTGGHEWHETRAEDDPIERYEYDWAGPRRDMRHDFSNAVHLENVRLPNTLRRASLDFMSPLVRTIKIHHEKDLPDLVSPALNDPFSSSLLVLFSSLRELRLRALVDGSLFWPTNNEDSVWPNLEMLEVMFHIARPDGGWYFQGPGAEGGDARGFEVNETSYPPLETSDFDDETHHMQETFGAKCPQDGNHQYRIAPHSPSIVPLLEGFAKAAASMHSLKAAVIWSPTSWHLVEDDYDSENEDEIYQYDMTDEEDLAWGIIYAAPLQRVNAGQSRMLKWLVEQWQPHPELRVLFQRIGRDTHGEELTELWTDELLDSPYVDRRYFERFLFSGDPGCIPLSHQIGKA